MGLTLGHLWKPHRVLKSAALAGLLALCLVGADLGGLVGALDNRLSELRFASNPRSPTGNVVLVDIDARSIGEIGVWPWPRHLYGDLLSAAAQAGAAKVAFDIDFSSSSIDAEDEAFAAALTHAGVETYLAAFAQPESAGTSAPRAAMPIERLLQASWPASVDVPLEADGKVRQFPHASHVSGEMLASLPSVLADRDGEGELFGIDYGISAEAIPRISLVDLLGGRLTAGALAGKTLIVGASAVELHDFFQVPVFGTISGSTVVALATETLLQHRELARTAVPGSYLVLIAIAALLASIRLRTGQAVTALAVTMLGVEITGFYLQNYGSIELATVRLHGLGLALIIWTLLREFGLGRLRLWIARIQVSNSESMLERVVDASFDGIVIVAHDGNIARANAEAAALLNVPLASLGRTEDLPTALRQSVWAVFQSGRVTDASVDRTLRQTALQAGDDDRVLEYSIAPFWMKGLATDAAAAADRLHICLTLRDVTDRERAQQRLRHQALHDSLTGLGNRRALEAAIADAGGTSGAAGGFALLVFDLDRFKAVNDSLGHGTGDEVLIETATRARKAFGDRAFIARIGGDEFAVLLDFPSVSVAQQAAGCFLQAMKEPFHIKGHIIAVASSVGIGWWPAGALDATEMMRKADIALYRAKSASSEPIVVFEDGMEVDRMARLAIEKDIERALDEGQFEVVYQPQVMIGTAEIIGAEALLRWRHPVRGYVSPAVFIPVAEEMGHIHRLGAFVLETACLEAARWPRHVKLAVNVSALQFEAGDIVSAVRHALSRSGLPAERLELEITESAFVAETNRLRGAFEALLGLGVSFALDDYGTGYSSLGYLHRFPISKIKIDRSFVTDAATSRQTVAVLRSIVALGEGLGIRTIAEGIETVEQAETLQALGCREAQGYLYSKPIAGAAFRCIVNGLVRWPEPLVRAAS